MATTVKDYVEERMEEGFSKMDIPGYMQDGIRHYILDGINPGHFLTYCLQNRFIEAVTAADDTNAKKLVDWAKYIYNYLPGQCHGSREAVENWEGMNNME